VLIEGFSVVVRRGAIDRKVQGGMEGFLRTVPNPACCFDDELVRVGFMAGHDAMTYVGHLRALGLSSTGGADMDPDLVVIDQAAHDTCPEPWLFVERVKLSQLPGEVCIASLKGTSDSRVALPRNWEYKGSLSEVGRRLPVGDASKLTFVRVQDGVEVYRDEESGEELYAGRAYGSAPASPTDADGAKAKSLIHQATAVMEQDRVASLLPPCKLGFFARRRVEKAIGLLDQALKLSPNDVFAHWLHGKSLQVLGRYEESLQSFARAWLLDPGQVATAREAGITATEAKHFDQAVYYAQQALALTPGDVGLRANLALAHLFAGNGEAAVTEAAAAYSADRTDKTSLAVLVAMQEVSAGRMPKPARASEFDQAMLVAAIRRFQDNA